MRKKQVWRFYCDFCKKANCSSFSISKHERGCTANPERQCGVCRIIAKSNGDKPPAGLAELITMLPEIDDNEIFNMMTEGTKSGTRAWSVLEKLREAAHGCPACILAAIRQSPTMSIGSYLGFDFKAEMKAFWEEYNAE